MLLFIPSKDVGSEKDHSFEYNCQLYFVKDLLVPPCALSSDWELAGDPGQNRAFAVGKGAKLGREAFL